MDFPILQQDVQRLLGRCMLRVQQYEQLMKAMLAHHQLAGPVNTLATQQEERLERVADHTLGRLVKVLFESYIVADTAERSDLLSESTVPTDRVSVAFQFSIAMNEERRALCQRAIADLVALRNDLVHHLVERFDLWSNAGCESAVAYLTHSYETIDGHYIELCGWAKSMDEARELSAAFIQSDSFHDLVVNGIAPNGSIDWPESGIVRVLREGLATYGVDGWASLAAVSTWISKDHPDQTPDKYLCRTWPQILHESGQFDLQY